MPYGWTGILISFERVGGSYDDLICCSSLRCGSSCSVVEEFGVCWKLLLRVPFGMNYAWAYINNYFPLFRLVGVMILLEASVALMFGVYTAVDILGGISYLIVRRYVGQLLKLWLRGLRIMH